MKQNWQENLPVKHKTLSTFSERGPRGIKGKYLICLTLNPALTFAFLSPVSRT